jgi:hypothetical protein
MQYRYSSRSAYASSISRVRGKRRGCISSKEKEGQPWYRVHEQGDRERKLLIRKVPVPTQNENSKTTL